MEAGNRKDRHRAMAPESKAGKESEWSWGLERNGADVRPRASGHVGERRPMSSGDNNTHGFLSSTLEHARITKLRDLHLSKNTGGHQPS